MKHAEPDAAELRRGHCSACSRKATNSCAGCLGAPAYDNGQGLQQTLYCSVKCQKAHWSIHKAECKMLQTRKSLFRVATVLDAVMGVIDAKGKETMIHLSLFLTELSDGIPVTIEEVGVVSANKTAPLRYIYKITLNATEIWATDPEQAYPPSSWGEYIRANCLISDSKKPLDFHRRNEDSLDHMTQALERQVASMVANRGGSVDWRAQIFNRAIESVKTGVKRSKNSGLIN